MAMMGNQKTKHLYERAGSRPAKGDDGKPLRIEVSDPSKSGQTVFVKAVNFAHNYKGIDRAGRDMRTSVLDRDWNPVKDEKTTRDASPKPEAKMTFADLLASLQKLTPEQLKHPAIWMGEERGGVVKEFFVQTEDQVCPDDESWEPRAAFLNSGDFKDYGLTRKKAEKLAIVSAKGQPYLMVD